MASSLYKPDLSASVGILFLVGCEFRKAGRILLVPCKKDAWKFEAKKNIFFLIIENTNTICTENHC
jgi:hypothetical protein